MRKKTSRKLRKNARKKTQKELTAARRAAQSSLCTQSLAQRAQRKRGKRGIFLGSLIAAFFLGVSLLGFLSYSAQGLLERYSTQLRVFMLLGLLGVRMAHAGHRRIRRCSNAFIYRDLLKNTAELPLETFAAQIHKRPKAAQKELLRVMKVKLLPDHYLDIPRGVIRNLAWDAQTAQEKREQRRRLLCDAPQSLERVPCVKCAHENLIEPGAVGICVCCGAAL